MKKILSVSVIAILSITSVNAADVPVLATKNYVNQGLDTKYDADKIVVSESGVTIDGTAIATKADISGMATDLNLANKLDKSKDLVTSRSNNLNDSVIAFDDKVPSEKAVAVALSTKVDTGDVMQEIPLESEKATTAVSANAVTTFVKGKIVTTVDFDKVSPQEDQVASMAAIKNALNKKINIPNEYEPCDGGYCVMIGQSSGYTQWVAIDDTYGDDN